MKGRQKGGCTKCAGVILCIALLCFNSGEQMSYIRNLSGSITTEELTALKEHMGGILRLKEEESRQVAENMSQSLNENNATVTIIGLPIKRVSCVEREDIRLMPGGMPIGVSIYTDGVLVVGLGSVYDDKNICPAAEGGIKAGDVITAVNGEKVTDSLHLSRLCGEGGSLCMTVRRGGTVAEYTIVPVYDMDMETYLAGMWVRDSTSGIGTLSFYDMESGRFGALGHPITDIDTGSVIDVKNGSITESQIIGVSAGANGSPGEVIGSFSLYADKWGMIDTNCQYGVYGESVNMPVNPIYPEGVPVGWANEVYIGEAEILCTVTDDGIAAYDCEIIKLFSAEESGSKGIVIKVTSPELITITGGIVQGMSGSPIIQDGKMVGAITHVLVNDPTKGYGIYVENMLEAAE